MRVVSLGSGSKGNATLVQFQNTTIMVDCGFRRKEVLKRLEAVGVLPSDVTAILVTHEHSDHLAGVASLAATYDIPVYMSAGTYRGWKGLERITPITIKHAELCPIADIDVLPVTVPHDSREAIQFVFKTPKKEFGILTDLGSITANILTEFANCHSFMVEANHDLQMLQDGPYPAHLKKRVAGDWGHLNNEQSAQFILDLEKTMPRDKIIIGHISGQNNDPKVVKTTFMDRGICESKLIFADQEKTTEWIQL